MAKSGAGTGRRRRATADAKQEATTTTRRRRSRKQEEAEAAEEEEAEEEEAAAKPRGRQARTYEVTAEGVELAEEVGVEVSEGDPATGELIKELRDAGMKWDGKADEENGLKHVFGAKSAIPLRDLLHQFEAANGDAIDPEDLDAIVDAADNQGWGWKRISRATGLSIKQVQELYVEGDGRFADDVGESGGRIYGKGDQATWHPGAAHGSQKPEEPEEEEAEEEAEEEEQPAPRRRRRRAAAASESE